MCMNFSSVEWKKSTVLHSHKCGVFLHTFIHSCAGEKKAELHTAEQ